MPLDFAFKDLTKTALTTDAANFRRVETTAAGLKAFSTWNTTHTLQTAREACGGEGYLSINRFAALKADSDIFTTFEGDNTVLMQLVARTCSPILPRPSRVRAKFNWPAGRSRRNSNRCAPGCLLATRTPAASLGGNANGRSSVCGRSGCCFRWPRASAR